MRVSLNSIGKVLSEKPVSINSLSIYNPNEIYACVELYDKEKGVGPSTPFRTLEAPPQSTLIIKGNSGLDLSFSIGLIAIANIPLPRDLILEVN